MIARQSEFRNPQQHRPQGLFILSVAGESVGGELVELQTDSDTPLGNRVLIEPALPVPVIPAKAGIQSDSAGADIPVARLDGFPLSRE